MASAGTGGVPAPDAEDGNELQREQQDEDERRRQQAQRLHDELAASSASAAEQQLQPARPDPAARASTHAAHLDVSGTSYQRSASHEADDNRQNERLSRSATSDEIEPGRPPRGWQDSLAERLLKLSEPQRTEYDRHLHNAIERNGAVSPAYQLDVAALLAKDLPKVSFGRDLHELNRREDEARRLEQLSAKPHHQRPAAGQNHASSTRAATAAPAETAPTKLERQDYGPARDAASPQRTSPAVRHDAERRDQHPSPRKAAPDRTMLVHKRLQHMLDHYAERRRQLNLPPGRAEQNEFARLDHDQKTTRKILLDRQSMELKLLDYQHVAERTAVAAQWLARDLKQARSPDASLYEKEARQVFAAINQAHERRQDLATQHGAAPQSLQPAAAPAAAALSASKPQDPNGFFKDGTALPTEDRLRAMLGRYQELREIRNMPSGVNEANEQARLATLQATVRRNILAQQSKVAQLLDYQHIAERAGASATWLARSADQPRYRTEARRAFSIARLALERSDAIDPRPRAVNDLVRAGGDVQAHRQAMAQETAKGGRTLTSEERANLPSTTAARDRSTQSSERTGGAGQDRGKPGPGGGQNSRGGGGRGR